MSEKLEIVVKSAGTSPAPRDNGTNVPQGAIARLGSRIQNTVNGWFGPGESLEPLAPPDSQIRTQDYPFSVNMNTTRQFEPIPWHQLRQFARAYPLLRMAIEHMKNRVCLKTWTVRVTKDPDETAQEHLDRSANDPRVQELTTLLKRPDLENSWPTWLRKFLTDYFILDAACISVQRTKGGGVWRLMVVDGSTIVRKIDMQGMTPVGIDPVTGKEAVAYQQIIKGVPYIDLTRRDLLYCAENIEPDRIYGYGRVEQVAQWLVLGMNRLLYQTEYYTSGSVPDTFAFLPEGTNDDQTERFDALFQKLMSGQSASRRKVWWMPWSGHVPVQMKSADLTDKMDEMLNRFICFAFGISPSALVSQVNRASAGQMADDADESGETPVTGFVADKINELIQSPLYFNYPDMEFSFEDPPEVDTIVQAEIDEIYFAMADQSGNGLQVLNEFRERDGLPPLDDNTPEPPPIIAPPPGPTAPNDPAGAIVADPEPKSPPKAKVAVSTPRTAKGTVLTIDPGKSTPAKAKARSAVAGVVKDWLAESASKVAKDVGLAYARQRKKHGQRRKRDADNLTDEEIQTIADNVMAGFSIDWSALAPKLDAFLQQAVTSGVTEAGTQLGVDHHIFDQANEWAIEYAQDRSAELVGMKYVDGKLITNPNAVWAITDTTRDTLRGLIVDALEDGDSVATLKKSIIDSTQFSAQRAEMIATTEVNFANSGGQFEVAKLVGHTFKRSILSGDHDDDDECDDNADADDLEITDAFPSGDFYSPFHPNCVCLTQTYEKDEEL